MPSTSFTPFLFGIEIDTERDRETQEKKLFQYLMEKKNQRESINKFPPSDENNKRQQKDTRPLYTFASIFQQNSKRESHLGPARLKK